LSSPDDISQRLRDLHESYADRVNRLLEEDRDDLAMEVADAYTDEAFRLIVASERRR
jgi:N-formylglutamate amidohydrolase